MWRSGMRVRRKSLATLASVVMAAGTIIGGSYAYAADQPQTVKPAAETLLSQGKPVTASSSGGCCAPSNAVDGKTTTRWASAANIDPSWIYVNLGASMQISRVQLIWDASCATA